MDANLDDALDVFQGVRRRLFGIAYRMLGSATEAEDVVQDTWLRWQRTDRSVVVDPPAFLATTATRLAINALQSARARRETYVGPWLPEPVDTSADPTLGAERAEGLGFAVLTMLEKLTPTERAAYVLHEAFVYPYSQIAEIIRTSEAAARQLVSRARKHLAEDRRREVSSEEQRRLLTAFVGAARTGDLDQLERLFAEDVVSYSDGGGVVRASRIPVHGRTVVAKFVRAFHLRFWEGVRAEEATINGQPSVVLSRDGTVFAVLTVVASIRGIDQVLWMMNPHKLGAVSRAA
ncbi:RNA polymerase sigma-70 factor [Agromyces sp. Marseille-P2726]|uniref:RNA polymerase sigma-70 factor n=1 Tax=Agromyces sp. Marseille-P2726 TaxID=2709132 RepID=UPI00157035C1|nr:RNA polymerase sigma-70 factor [Agromyces sp. Marseille-P2726]